MTLAVLLLLVAPNDATRRYALIVGANDGGQGRATLRYASSDARAMATVLGELGGVDAGDTVLLLDATVASLRSALHDMKERLAVAARTGSGRLEFILYYSGHSDEEGLLLRGQRLPYEDLRANVAAMPGAVRVAILDSCASGALLRLKGGKRRQAFLRDASVTPKGHAFITSSSADESAQESDRVGGSFFTHYFVSGLRGAADVTGDKRVTLNEAYQFAFAETLARTERTQGGPQHASYDIQLAGSGDLVFTDVRSTRAGLVVEENVAGRLFVRDGEERLVVELYKAPGRAVELGLAGGAYRVTNETATGMTVAKVALSEGRRVSLNELAFLPVEREVTAARGGRVQAGVDAHRLAVVSLLSPLASNAGDERTSTPLLVQVVYGQVTQLHGFAVGFGVNDVTGEAIGDSSAFIGNLAGTHYGLQVAGVFNFTHREMHGLQTSFGFNGARGYVSGLQLAMGANYAEALSGMQVALLNIGGAVSGFQLGLLNIASAVQGFQLGLVNISQETSGAQLGLFSYSGNVPLRLQLYWSDSNAINAAVRYGSRVLYGVFLTGLQPFYGEVRGQYGMGLGLHGQIKRFNVDFDLSVNHLLRGRAAFLRPAVVSTARLMVGVDVIEHLMPFIGATANLGIWGGSNRESDEVFSGLSVLRAPQAVDGTLGNARFWFGVVAGIQF